MSTKVIDGVTHVWSILDNAWVSLDYWNWVNQIGKYRPKAPAAR